MAQLFIDQGLVELLSTLVDDETNAVPVFANIVPEDQRPPFVSYQRITGDKIRDINGPSGLSRTVFQVDTYSDDYLEAKRIADQIRLTLDGFRGTVTIVADSVRVAGCSMQAERDFVEEDTNPKLYRTSVDYLFTFDEEI